MAQLGRLPEPELRGRGSCSVPTGTGRLRLPGLRPPRRRLRVWILSVRVRVRVRVRAWLCVWKGPSAGRRRTTRIGIAVVVHRGLAGASEAAAESWAPSLVQSLLVKHLGRFEKKSLLRCHWHIGPVWRTMHWAARRGNGFMARLGTRYGRTFGTDRAVSEASLPGAMVAGRPVVRSGGLRLRNGTALTAPRALAVLPLGTTPLCC